MKIRPDITPHRELFEVIFEVNYSQKPCAKGFKSGRYALVLCTQCLAKRRKEITWNRTARANMAYDDNYSTRLPDVYYHIKRNIRKEEKVECLDCKYKIRGR